MCHRVTVALLLTVCAQAGSWAAVTEGGAREAAENAFGVDLANAACEVTDADARCPHYRFSVRGDAGVSSYMVAVESGEVVGYRLPRPSAGTPQISEAAALEVARAELHRWIGDAADDVRWASPVTGPDTYEFRPLPALAGDPPREGLTPDYQVVVSRVSGRTVRFFRYTPPDTTPIAPAVTSDEAVEIARAAFGHEAASVVGEPRLAQHECGPGTLTWTVKMRAARDPGAGPGPRLDPRVGLYAIDALSGSIISGGEAGDRAASSRAASQAAPGAAPAVHAVASEATPSPHPWPLLSAGAALLLAAGVGVVLLRRRR